MIKSYKDERFDYILNALFPNKEILKYSPIIAGGFPLSIYRALKLYDTEEKYELLLRLLKRETYSSIKENFKFGDIDLWFTEDSIVANPSDKESEWLNLLASANFKDTETFFRSYNTKGSPKENIPGISDVEEDRLVRAFAAQKLCVSEFESSSVFANTFKIHHGEKTKYMLSKVQFIKKRAASPEALLSEFDFVNCRVAWHDGVVYIDSELDSAFKDFSLSMKNDSAYSESSTIGTKVFNALRAFKYAKRYALDFDEQLAQNVFQTYMAVKDLDKQPEVPAPANTPMVNSALYQSKLHAVSSSLPSLLPTPATIYGMQVELKKQKFLGMVEGFVGNFEEFTKQKHYKEDWSLYFIDRVDRFPCLKKIIDPVLTKDADSSNVAMTLHGTAYGNIAQQYNF